MLSSCSSKAGNETYMSSNKLGDLFSISSCFELLLSWLFEGDTSNNKLFTNSEKELRRTLVLLWFLLTEVQVLEMVAIICKRERESDKEKKRKGDEKIFRREREKKTVELPLNHLYFFKIVQVSATPKRVGARSKSGTSI